MSLPPLIPGLAPRDDETRDCGCCEGIATATPSLLLNRPGLPSVTYRPGRHADFRASQLARLSSDDHPALADLKSRDEDDFTIALIDSWSCVLDVLSFYQERHANEAWLATATERLSVVELGRLIGYRPRPGVAAATELVFLMDDPPGADASVAGVVAPIGTRVQSVPGPNEVAQTFETVEAIEARVAWNALVPRRSRFKAPKNGDLGTWIAGGAPNLKVGDAILIVGRERTADFLGSERWDFRKLTRIVPDVPAGRTWIEWTHALGSIDPPSLTAQVDHRIFVFRARASLFGWNAPHPKVLPTQTLTHYGQDFRFDWPFDIDTANSRLHLDAIYPDFVAGSWIAVTRPDEVVEAYRITAAVDDGRADFTVSSRVTRLTLDSNEHLSWFESGYRRVSVYGGSEQLAFAETPIITPIIGDEIELSGLVAALKPGHRLMLRGRRAQVEAATAGLILTAPGTPPQTRPIVRGERLTLLAAPVAVSPGSSTFVWRLRAAGGFEGSVQAAAAAFRHIVADAKSETIAEVAILEEAELADETHTLLRFETVLAAAFDRATTVIHANVAAATHGETTQEILGDGKANQSFQTFRLKQTPLTHISAANEAGASSTLSIRIDDILWHEAPTLYGRSASERIFTSRIEDDGTVVVQFGDGRTGSRLPTGRNNAVATYRKGIGLAGSVGANKLTTALDRPLGLRDVFNPLPAGGGQDPETLATARDNAPVTTLTLGRVVSLRNYEDFARGFAGIAKASASWAWDGESRRIIVTVAGPGGAPVDPAHGDVFDNLVRALRTLGDPFVRISVASFRPAFFRLKAKLLVNADYLADKVRTDVEAALRDAFGFDRRGFAPLVAASEIIATIHGIAGVDAVDLDLLHRTSGPGSAAILHDRLLASPAALAGGVLAAAEILTLDPGPLALEVIQ
ncbi:putative baseplate assembly protein [Sphingomonas sp. DBB INV C78]|uniref:putative baseplate assembly protein n=1 Tax=Sphingomonas sp. DBB INV C78 TaxID=3349434 RepID=UPI0036D3D0CE